MLEGFEDYESGDQLFARDCVVALGNLARVGREVAKEEVAVWSGDLQRSILIDGPEISETIILLSIVAGGIMGLSTGKMITWAYWNEEVNKPFLKPAMQTMIDKGVKGLK